MFKFGTVIGFVLMWNLRFFQRCCCWRLKTSGTVWTGKYLTMFRKCVLPTSPGPSSNPSALPFDHEDAGRPSHRLVWKYLPKDSSPYLWILETLNWWCFDKRILCCLVAVVHTATSVLNSIHIYQDTYCVFHLPLRAPWKRTAGWIKETEAHYPWSQKLCVAGNM